MAGRFAFLPTVIPFTFALYFGVASTLAVIHNFCSCAHTARTRRDQELKLARLVNSMRLREFGYLATLERFFDGDGFETTYQSCWGQRGTLVLFNVRLFSFAYLFFISFLYRYTISPMYSIYFTAWNVNLLSLYFLLAIIASCIGLANDKKLQEYTVSHSRLESHPGQFWSLRILRFGWTLQILFEISGATALFVTIIAFTLLAPEFTFWTASYHFVTSVCIVAELSLNNMTVRWDHVLLNLTWIAMYLVYCWPMTRYGALSDWPYFFMDTSKPEVIRWYTIIFLANISFFYLFWSVNLVKYLFVEHFMHSKYPLELLPKENIKDGAVLPSRDEDDPLDRHLTVDINSDNIAC